MAESGAWQRERRVAAALLVAVVIVAILLAGHGTHRRSATRPTARAATGGTPNTELFTNVSAPDGPLTTPAPAPAPPTTAVAAMPSVPSPAPSSVPASVSSAAPSVLSGQVVDGAGRPVPDAYIVGLHSTSVTRTDPSGEFSMPCPDEPLLASSWLPTLSASGAAATPPPTDEALGYGFTGSATAGTATTPACGSPLRMVLPQAATLHVSFPEGTMPGRSPISAHLPGLGLSATPVSLDPARGDLVLSGLDPGMILLTDPDGLTCDGPVTVTPTRHGVELPLTSGRSTSVSCW